jgi:hypothetical protein
MRQPRAARRGGHRPRRDATKKRTARDDGDHAEEHLTVDVFAEYDPRDNAVNTPSSRGDAPRDNDQGRYAYLLES